MEASEALSTLQQCNSLKPRVFMIRRYTNTPFIPQGTSRLLDLNVSDLPQGTSSTQFPLDSFCLWKLLPYSKTEALLPHEEGEMGYRTYPFHESSYGNVLKRLTTYPILWHYQCPHQLHPPSSKKACRQR